MATAQQITTAQELLATPNLGRCELIRGELILMSPAGFNHGRIVSRIDRRMGAFVEAAGLGEVTGAEIGYCLGRKPDTVRAPDVGFVRRQRLGVTPILGFFPGAPDLAVEVLSPDDRPREVLAKAQDWLDAGCEVVWIVDPAKRMVAVHRSGIDTSYLGENDTLSAEGLLPGFQLRVAEIFG
jgi:Uma2 family endonuclease